MPSRLQRRNRMSLVRDDWMAKMATETQSVIAMESHGELVGEHASSWSKGITLLLPLASRYAYIHDYQNIRQTHKCEVFNALEQNSRQTWTPFLRLGSWKQKNFNSNTANEPARSSTREHNLAEQPLVMKATFSKLDDNKIVHDLKRWHDINFDPDLHFRSNLDCGKGKGTGE